MSALSEGETEEGDKKTYSFHQPIPTPSYLIALVIGDLVSSDIGILPKSLSDIKL